MDLESKANSVKTKSPEREKILQQLTHEKIKEAIVELKPRNIEHIPRGMGTTIGELT